MILAPCPVGFWRTSALIRQILVLRYLVASRTLCRRLPVDVNLQNVPTDPYPACWQPPFLGGSRDAEKAVVEKWPSNRQELFCACTLRVDRRGSRGLGPLGPVESQVRVARVCGKTSAAARLISRGRAPRAEPEYTTALLLVISVGLTRSAS